MEKSNGFAVTLLRCHWVIMSMYECSPEKAKP